MPPHQCNLGVDLFTPQENWPQQRFIYSAGGDSLERIFIMRDSAQIVFDRIRNEYLNLENVGAGYKLAKFPEEFRKFYELISPVHYYLVSKNAYFPEESKHHNYMPTSIKPAIFASHRGNVNGPGNQQMGNNRQSLDAAVNAGFEWVEIDIQFTDDGIPVLLHDPYFEVQGRKIYINNITLDELNNFPGFRNVLTLEEVMNEYADRINFLIEIKPLLNARLQLHAAREISKMIRYNRFKNKIIVDSFQDDIASSVKQQCDCEVGYDTPFMKKLEKDNLLYIKKLGLDWIYVHYSVVDDELIRSAHELGLKVMAYTVNSPEVIEGWMKKEMPDGIITDYNSIKEQYSPRF